METAEKRKRKGLPETALLLLLIAAVGAMFWLLNRYTPLGMDDFDYSLSFADGSPLTSARQIVPSMISHYQKTNGRVLVHSLLQLMLLWGKPVFNLVNTAVFLALGLLITAHGAGSPKKHLPGLLVTCCGLLMMTPAFGQSYLWMAGACNYLWGIVIALFYLLPFSVAARRDGEPKKESAAASVLKAAGMLIAGFLAGATTENVAGTVILAGLLFMLAFRFPLSENGKRKPVRAWMATGTAGAVCGLATLLYAKKIIDELQGHIFTYSLRDRAIVFAQTTANLFAWFWPVLAAAAVSIIVWRRRACERSGRARLKETLGAFSMPIIYLVSGLAAAYSMVLAGRFPLRVWCGPAALLIAGGLASLETAFAGTEKEPRTRNARRLAAAVIGLAAFGVFLNARWDVRAQKVETDAREALIARQLAEGETDVRIPSVYTPSRFCIFETPDINRSSKQWPNMIYAEHYGAARIIRDDNIVLP